MLHLSWMPLTVYLILYWKMGTLGRCLWARVLVSWELTSVPIFIPTPEYSFPTLPSHLGY